MRKDFGAKPFLYPMPVLIIASYDEAGVADAMNAAWGGMADADKIVICLDASHKTVKNILERKAFTVSMANAQNVIACDYVGIVSANKEPEKIKKTRWTVTKSQYVDAPLINELPMALECELISYDTESELMIGRIINVCAEESILNEEGNIDPKKLDPITYDPCNHEYLTLGEKVADAFKCGAELK